ncbi:MAG: DUF2828 family protein [Desulfovibrio sp.]|nr:DUF2828 family protein [Desulfovibrio sp.]
MLNALKETANMTTTENGAWTHASSGSDCLDFFATVGALRSASEEDIVTRFQKAHTESADLAVKTAFFARDIRGGLGERHVFRILERFLAVNEPASMRKNIPHVAEYGRFDDLFILFDTPCEQDMLAHVQDTLAKDMEKMQADAPVSPLGKWLPSVNASNDEAVRMAKKFARALGMNDAAYRKTLSSLRAHIKIIENNLRLRDYTFAYEKQPSRALLKYRNAFQRNDKERYVDFLRRAATDKTLLHTAALTPYDVIAPILCSTGFTDAERLALDTTWKSLDDFTGGENALVVADGSGSMYWGGNPLPAAVAQSLAIYFAERNTGAFHNHFITFSTNPRLVEIKGKDIVDKVRYCLGYDECANTDLAKVFDLILRAALSHNLSSKDLPARLYIISDMEFDACCEHAEMTNFAYAKAQFAQHGYTLPQVVFWNVQSRNTQQPVQKNEQGVALVSGCTPQIFSLVKNDRLDLDPYSVMLDVLSSERYAVIAA